MAFMRVKDKDGNIKPILAIKGEKGESAYQIAQADGFEGTSAEWLQSLIGPKGDAPVRGEDYWTDEDKTSIVQEVIELAPGSNIDIDLDSSNNGEATPINASTLNGKYESDLYVAKSLDSDKLGGVLASEYAKKSEVVVQTNFCIVGGTTVPNDPTENMIWINTDVPITETIFNEIEPANTANGIVWIYTHINSNVSFNMLKIGTVYADPCHPLRAKQFINNEWVEKIGKIRQNNKWVDLDDRFFIFEEGRGLVGEYSVKCNFTEYGFAVSQDKITVSTNTALVTNVWVEPKVDVSKFEYLYIEMTCNGAYDSNSRLVIAVGEDSPQNNSIGSTSAQIGPLYYYNSEINSRQIYQLQVKGIIPDQYIKILASGITGTIHNIWLGK